MAISEMAHRWANLFNEDKQNQILVELSRDATSLPNLARVYAEFGHYEEACAHLRNLAASVRGTIIPIACEIAQRHVDQAPRFLGLAVEVLQQPGQVEASKVFITTSICKMVYEIVDAQTWYSKEDRVIIYECFRLAETAGLENDLLQAKEHYRQYIIKKLLNR